MPAVDMAVYSLDSQSSSLGLKLVDKSMQTAFVYIP
jgi:hypothetical protein